MRAMRKMALAAALSGIVGLCGHLSAEEAAASPSAEACIAKLAETANRPAADIKVVGTAPDGGGETITLDLDGAESVWICHVDAGGNVVDGMYDGEG